MVKQSPSRNNRSRGVKVKNVLQICVLLAVCFWLIYQVKHSHDKKKAFDVSDGKKVNPRVHDEILKFGRRELRPRLEETVSETEEAGDEEEKGGDEDNNKHEEEDVEDKHEEEEIIQVKREEEGDQDQDKHGEEEEEEQVEDNNEGKDVTKREEEEEQKQVEDAKHEEEEEEVEDHKHEEGSDQIEDNEEEEKRENHKLEEEDQVEGNKHEAEEEQENEKIHENEDEGRVLGGGGGDDEIDEHEQEKSAVEVAREIEGEKVREADVNESVDKRQDQNNEGSSDDHSAAHEAREENYKADDASSAVTHETETEKGNSENTSEIVDEIKSNNTEVAKPEEDTMDENDALPNSTASVEKGFEMASSALNITQYGSNSTVSTDSVNTDETEKSEDGVGIEEDKHDPIDASDSSVLLDKDIRTDLDTLPEAGAEGGQNEDVAAE